MRKMTPAWLGPMVVLILTAGCATREPFNSRLDAATGLTVVALHEPVTVARAADRLTVAGRDYAYLGPVEINRMGQREHYLWLGMASTVDRALVGETPPRATELILIVDGVPMRFPLSTWSPQLDTPPYAMIAPVYDSLAGRASLDQINRIAAAESLEVHIVMDVGKSAAYRWWDGSWLEWETLAAQAEHRPEVREARNRPR